MNSVHEICVTGRKGVSKEYAKDIPVIGCEVP
jgi:hypothetical protein